MKRDLSFYMIFIMCLFITCYITSYILASRTIELGGLLATSAAFVYPLTYFLAVVFYERYGKNKVFELINKYRIDLLGGKSPSFCSGEVTNINGIPIKKTRGKRGNVEIPKDSSLINRKRNRIEQIELSDDTGEEGGIYNINNSSSSFMDDILSRKRKSKIYQ